MRRERDFSQKNFAAVAGLGRTYMGRVECGEQNISIQIAFALKVEIGALIPTLSELERPTARLGSGANSADAR